jgi:hypothetical protein
MATVSTMRVLQKNSVALAAGFLLVLTSASAMASFEVSKIEASAGEGKLTVSGEIDLSLNNKVEEAVSKGIPLDVEIELRLYRERPIIWSRRVASWTLRRQIRYHALSGQYLVLYRDRHPRELESFTSLQEALHQMGTLNSIDLKIGEPIQSSGRYKLESRVTLDIESLPPPLRPVAYTSLAWHLNSGWSTWTVQH